MISGALVGRYPYPPGAVPLTASQTATAAASCAASLPATAGITNYLTKATLSAAAVAAVVSGVATITDGTWTLKYDFVETVSAGGFVDLNFNPPLVASGPNTAMTVTIPVITGGAVTAVSLVGFQG